MLVHWAAAMLKQRGTLVGCTWGRSRHCVHELFDFFAILCQYL